MNNTSPVGQQRSRPLWLEPEGVKSMGPDASAVTYMYWVAGADAALNPEPDNARDHFTSVSTFQGGKFVLYILVAISCIHGMKRWTILQFL